MDEEEEEEFFDTDDSIQDKLQSFLGKIPENFSVLEEEVDMDVQMEYFKFAKNLPREKDKNILAKKDLLFNDDTPIDDKKEILVNIAGIDDPKAFRILEEFKEAQKGKELFDWAAMAYQENRMLLEGSLLEENQVFISTGMGGKGKLLRYFVVFIPEYDEAFTNTQAKLIKSEVEYAFAKTNAEIEEYNIDGDFVTLTVLISLDINIKDLFSRAIDECNELGGFVSDNFIVTNVKKLSAKEIDEFINKTEQEESDGEIELFE